MPDGTYSVTLSYQDALGNDAATSDVFTGVMVALGKVRGNLMIDLHTTSSKLRDRAVRVVTELMQCDYDSAHSLLQANGWNLRAVVSKIEK